MLLALLFFLLLLLIALGVPVAISLAASSAIFLLIEGRVPEVVVIHRMVNGVDSFPLLAIPFFILAGNLMNSSGITERIFDFAKAIFGWMRGGLGHVNVGASVIFAGMSGAAVADAGGLGAIEIKAMRERGYKPDFAAAITVASSVIGPLIPPSIGLVLYAFLAQQSIERMFLAGLIPGILVGLALMIYVRIRAQFQEFPTQRRATVREVAGTAKHGFLALVAPAIILGSIMFGFVTATEAGVLACIYCILIGIWYKELTFRAFFAALSDTAMMTAVIMIIIAFSIAMGWLLAIDQTPQKLADFTFALTDNKNVFLALLLVFIILVGCVVEGVPAKLILVPTLLPLIDAYGIDRVHFGIIIQLGLLIGIATPPMGIGLYIVSEVGRVRFEKVTMAVLPMLVPLFAVLILLTYVPQTVTFLPDLILGPQN